jgi:hypothetical protein
MRIPVAVGADGSILRVLLPIMDVFTLFAASLPPPPTS